MKVLHVCETMLGGVGTHQNELVPLQQKILGVDQVHFFGPREDLVQIPDVDPSSIHTFSRPSRWAGLPRLTLGFLRVLFQVKPDVIHVHSTFAGVIVRFFAPFFRVPVVYCPHGWAVDRYKNRFMRWLVGFLERLFSHVSFAIVAVSDAERRRGIEIGIDPRKLHVIFNGLRPALPSFEPVAWNDDRLKVLFVGRLDRQKGIDVLMRAVGGLQEKIAVRIVGDSVADEPENENLDAPHVERLGWLKLPEVAAQMAACDVVAIPSRWEGLPIVALEAMRLRKPIVAARVGGLPEAVADGETGFIFEAEDHETLRRLLLSLNADTCRAFGLAGEKRFRDLFLAEQMSAAILQLYREAVL